MGDTNDYRMATTETALRRSIDERGGSIILTLDPAFQGLPDTAHGGSVLAAFDALAGLTTPREVMGLYKKRVPLATPLALAVTRADGAHTFVLRDEDGNVLVDGRVAPAADRRAAPGPRRDPLLLGVAGRNAPERSAAGSVASVVSEGAGRGAAYPLPVSRTCFACGTDNPLGLRVQLEADDAEVRGMWRPREPFHASDGTLATAALTTLADEAAFWLGALATGESGMTTDLRVTLHRAVPSGGAITVRGARASARPQADPRYWDTEVELRTAGGALAASARITFVAVRGAARRLVTGMLAINPPAAVRRVFPAYVR
jgi:acyl-coenzyme A thioesterase PaaI-like protein